MVKTTNGRWKMCVDLTDLSDTCSKDFLSLPRNDTLIDATFHHEMLRFKNRFGGYNQIKVHKENMLQGILCN